MVSICASMMCSGFDEMFEQADRELCAVYYTKRHFVGKLKAKMLVRICT